ncbi:hypothetical protein SAM19_03758 [Brevibacillus laterosporus]|nr:hypothetical protein [Brevibacillus laterosporus]
MILTRKRQDFLLLRRNTIKEMLDYRVIRD